MTNFTHNFFIWLFQFSTISEQPRAHHQENQLYQYNIWYVSLPTYILDGHLHRVTNNRCCIDTIDSPDDEHGKELPDLHTHGHLHRVTHNRYIDTIDSPDDEHEVARNM
jgi:hypothetical protein